MKFSSVNVRGNQLSIDSLINCSKKYETYDSDTIAAICGQLAGSHYGKLCISTSWIDKLNRYHIFHHNADQLLRFGVCDYRLSSGQYGIMQQHVSSRVGFPKKLSLSDRRAFLMHHTLPAQRKYQRSISGKYINRAPRSLK